MNIPSEFRKPPDDKRTDVLVKLQDLTLLGGLILMKTVYKFFAVGFFFALAAFLSPTFAQDVCADIEANQAKYETYTKNYKGDLEQKKIAVKAGKEYIETYSKCPTYEQQVEWLKKNVPLREADIKKMEEEIAKEKRYKRFNDAAAAGNTPEIYAAGADILKYEPEFLDLVVFLGWYGYDESAVRNNDKFNSETISYAKKAIKMIEDGAKSDNFGLFGYQGKTKENTLGWMNYTIGWIENFRLKNKESGLNYLYKATQYDSEPQDMAFIYALVGDKYIEKMQKTSEEGIAIIKQNENRETFESKTKLALAKGYADRAIDAYSRAYDLAKAELAKSKPADQPKKQDYVTGLYDTLKNLYKFRYETVEDPITDEELTQKLSSHIAQVKATKFPNPTSEVEPVDPPTKEDETPADSTSTTSTNPAPPAPKVAEKTVTNGAKSDADRNNNKPNKQ